MVSLTSVSERFLIPFTVIEGGRGTVLGIISETDQNSQPSYIFVRPRHVLRAMLPTAIKPGMVLRSPAGLPFIVGANGPSETVEGSLWQSYRLFEPTGRYPWMRRTTIKDPVSRLDHEGPLQDMGLIWVAIEPMDREVADREMRVNFEQARFITGANVQSDDLVDNRRITKVDKQLGLSIGVVT